MAAKEKNDPASGLTPADAASPDGEQPVPEEVGRLVLTAVPQTPAAEEAREALLKAITSEATAIAKAKDKDKAHSADALEALARAYTLVTTGAPSAAAVAGSSGLSLDVDVRRQSALDKLAQQADTASIDLYTK
jgi:hypothetical protein